MDGYIKFETEIYPRIWNLAYNAGFEARDKGLPRICNLNSSPFVTPSGNILRVYKSAWEGGWDSWDHQTHHSVE
jgi:hypothetical protein